MIVRLALLAALVVAPACGVKAPPRPPSYAPAARADGGEAAPPALAPSPAEEHPGPTQDVEP